MTTFAQAVAGQAARWSVLIRIDALGDASGQWTFCSTIPSYAIADASFKPWPASWPDILSERIDPKGGVPEAGSIEFELLDPAGDKLTAILGMHGAPISILGADVTASATTFQVTSSFAFAGGNTPYFIGTEAFVVTSIIDFTHIGVTRAQLGTDALRHSAGDSIYAHSPSLRNRRVQLFLVPTDATSNTEEKLFGTYSIDSVGFDELMCAYKLAASSQFKYLDRSIPYQLSTFITQPTSAKADPHAIFAAPNQQWAPYIIQHWPGDNVWLKLGDEIVSTNHTNGSGELYSTVAGTFPTRQVRLNRGELGTARGPEPIPANTLATQIMVANRQSACSFRWSPGQLFTGGSLPSTSVGSGTWLVTDHPALVLLCMLTSSYVPSDNFATTGNTPPSNGPVDYTLPNYDASYGNFSSLPIGFGAGIPASLIDFASFFAVYERTQNWRVDAFYYGDEIKSFRELISEQLLQPFGLYLYTNGGKLGLALPRIPTQAGSGSVATIDKTNILRQAQAEDDSRANLGTVSGELSGADTVSAVSYQFRSAGQDVETVVSNESYKDVLGQNGYYSTAASLLKITIPVRVDASGGASLISDLGITRLFDFSRDTLTLELETDLSLWSLVPGQVVLVTLAQLPNFTTAARGWTNRPCVVVERSIGVDPKEGARMRFKFRAYAQLKSGLVAPCARISSVASNTATCQANTYTEPNNANGWPTKDVAAFNTGDRVKLSNLDLSDVATTPAFQTVQNVNPGTNAITLDGNFGGSWGANFLLRYVGAGTAAAQQTGGYVFMSDDALLTYPNPWRLGPQ